MKVAILGANGQLGSILSKVLQAQGENQLLPLSQDQFDVTEITAQNSEALKKFNPDYIVNCAAYTAVDRAEQEHDRAHLINGESLRKISQLANDCRSRLVHISTDFVFDGSKNTPYVETDACRPLSIYGSSKLLGEKLVEELCESYTIIRTSWLYSIDHPSFLKTMLRLAADRKQIKVVVDQIGTPTSAQSLADGLSFLMNERLIKSNELYHFSNLGVASWYDFASMIFYLQKMDLQVLPIPSKEYPTPAERPRYSVLSKDKFSQLGYQIPHWFEALSSELQAK